MDARTPRLPDSSGSTGPGSGSSSTDLSSFIAQLASIAVAGTVEACSTEGALRHVVQLAKDLVPSVGDVSITMIENGQPRTVVFVGALAVALDERQYELGFGPCLDAARTGQVVIVDEDDADSPYRPFAAVAARAGIHQTISLGLPVGARSIGGLNVYRTVSDPVPEPLVQQMLTFSAAAASVVNNIASYAKVAAEAAHLRTAMDSRAGIEQAKGILMAREQCTPDEAFALLTRISQHRHIKLRDLAASIIAEAAQGSTR